MDAGRGPRPGSLVLVTGGTRSGKSVFAERLAAGHGGPVLYVATAEAGDAEMAARIAVHQARRPATWSTVEARFEPARAVREWAGGEPTVLMDCLSLLVSNVLLAEGERGEPAPRLARLVEELVTLAWERPLRLIVVTSEVGSGLVPPSALARRYCDLLGAVNQQIAQAADQVYLVVAGLGVELRTLAVEPGPPP